MSAGWEVRLQGLRNEAERKITGPLRLFGWNVIETPVEDGEYLLIEATRLGHTYTVGLLYSGSTANKAYRALDAKVEHIFVRGGTGNVGAFAAGVTKPISSLDEFHNTLMAWNAASAPGKFGPEPPEPITAKPRPYRRLVSETPIDAIWLRLRQFGSVTLANKLVLERAASANITLDPAVAKTKAEGLAYTVRNAADYFESETRGPGSQRILNLYYGAMAFACAEMLSAPTGAKTLVELENSTKQGHGLFTLDGAGDGLEQLVVGPIASGFFATWTRLLGHPTDKIPAKKPRQYSEVAAQDTSTWITVEQLFARVPEIADLFVEIFASAPAWVMPEGDMEANRTGITLRDKRAPRTYVQFVDHSTRASKELISSLPGPISEIVEVASTDPGRRFRAAISHDGHDNWSDVLRVHYSPFIHGAVIQPIFGVITEYRAICLVLLYALSIVVRYRPSLWRRVQEGDLDHMRVLTDAFVSVVERVLPEQFLAAITGQRVVAGTT